MNCCEQHAPYGCDQGRNCPVRAARNSGVCSTEPDPEPESMFWPAAVMVLACAAFVGICFLGAAAHTGVI